MPKKILIAEDQWELRNLLKLFLEDYDLEFVESEDGIQTIEFAKTHRPDLIFLDNNLPGFPGYEIIQRMKLIPEIANIPVVLFVSKKIEDEMQAINQLGVIDILQKPYEEDKLISALRKVFGIVPKKSVAPAETKFSDIEKTVVLSPEELPFEKPQVSKEPPEPPSIEQRFTISKSFDTSSSDIEKTVILPPEELPNVKPHPSVSSVKPVEETEKTVVLPPEELPFIRETQPEIKSIEDGKETEKTVVLSPEELPINRISESPPTSAETFPVVPTPTQSEEKIQTEIAESLKPAVSEIPVKPHPQPTKYYTVSGISIKEFLGCLFNIPVSEKIQKDTRAFLVVAYGSEIVPEDLFNILDVFVGSVVTIDYEIFFERIKDLISLGANLFEIEPSAFKKL